MPVLVPVPVPVQSPVALVGLVFALTQVLALLVPVLVPPFPVRLQIAEQLVILLKLLQEKWIDLASCGARSGSTPGAAATSSVTALTLVLVLLVPVLVLVPPLPVRLKIAEHLTELLQLLQEKWIGLAPCGGLSGSTPGAVATSSVTAAVLRYDSPYCTLFLLSAKESKIQRFGHLPHYSFACHTACLQQQDALQNPVLHRYDQ